MATQPKGSGAMCEHRMPAGSHCKRCDEEKAAKAARVAVKTKPKPGTLPAPMTEDDREHLVLLEEVVEQGLGTFVEVGAALVEIRDSRLYREEHGTFEAYCRERWSMGRNYANKLIGAAEVSSALAAMGTVVPKTARQARELLPLLNDPKALKSAWEKANADGRPTAKKVREAVGTKPTKQKPAPIAEVCLSYDDAVTCIRVLAAAGEQETLERIELVLA